MWGSSTGRCDVRFRKNTESVNQRARQLERVGLEPRDAGFETKSAGVRTRPTTKVRALRRSWIVLGLGRCARRRSGQDHQSSRCRICPQRVQGCMCRIAIRCVANSPRATLFVTLAVPTSTERGDPQLHLRRLNADLPPSGRGVPGFIDLCSLPVLGNRTIQQLRQHLSLIDAPHEEAGRKHLFIRLPPRVLLELGPKFPLVAPRPEPYSGDILDDNASMERLPRDMLDRVLAWLHEEHQGLSVNVDRNDQ